MKPAPRFHDELRRAPRCSLAAVSFYQTPARHQPGESSASRRAKLREFRALGEHYFRAEAPAQQRRELVLFTLIGLISTWPVAMAIKLAVAAATW